MVLSLAYRTGVAVERDAAMRIRSSTRRSTRPKATLDVEARKAKMEAVEKILQDDAVMIMPLCRPVYTIVTKNVHGYRRRTRPSIISSTRSGSMLTRLS